jgi:hypothetical protein
LRRDVENRREQSAENEDDGKAERAQRHTRRDQGPTPEAIALRSI